MLPGNPRPQAESSLLHSYLTAECSHSLSTDKKHTPVGEICDFSVYRGTGICAGCGRRATSAKPRLPVRIYLNHM